MHSQYYKYPSKDRYVIRLHIAPGFNIQYARTYAARLEYIKLERMIKLFLERKGRVELAIIFLMNPQATT